MRLEKLASESDQLVTAADTVIQDIFDAALYAKETGNDGMVAELKASLKTALLKQNELRTRAAELRRAKEEGTSAEEVAKYAARAIAEVRTPSPPPASLLPPCLSLAAWPDSFFSFGLAPQNEGSKWIDVERHSEKWRDFEREIEGKSGAADAAAGEVEDEDIAVVGLTQAQQAGIRNQRCPISGKDIGDLDDPVRDSKGYIYERIAIEGYLSQGRGRHISKRCPVAGANHMVAVADLQSAQMQVRAVRRRERLTQNQNENDEVMDL